MVNVRARRCFGELFDDGSPIADELAATPHNRNI